MKHLVETVVLTATGTALSFTALGLSPAQALLWDFTFYNKDGQVGQVTLDDLNLTYSSLDFNQILSEPVAGQYNIDGELKSGTFLVNFAQGYSLEVYKLYSYWSLYNEPDAKGELLIGSPRIGNGFLGCNSVTPDNSFSCVKYTTREPASDPVSVPEPLTILGSVTAFGFGALLKREYSIKVQKAKSRN